MTKDDKEDSKLVVPGEEIVSGLDYLVGAGTYRKGDKIYAKVIGLAKTSGRVVFVIPLNGIYMPKRGDYVIGEISYVSFSNWKVEINSPYDATLPISEIEEFVEKSADLSKYFKVGDLIFAGVVSVTEGKIVQLTMKDSKARKLYGGKVVNITPTKVPRLIGKAGTMINMIKDKTKCIISVGQNGRVWMKGEKENLATDAIALIDKFSHVNGLTDKVSEFLEKGDKNEKA